MSKSILGRVEVTNDISAPKHYGLKGYALGGYKSETGTLIRVSLDDGQVVDLPSIALDLIETDITDELTRPDLPAVKTDAEQLEASRQAARVFELHENNREMILKVEAEIQTQQALVAARIRGLWSELYESQRITGIVFSQHEARIKAGAEAVWQSKGRPVKGKTFGAAQIADEWVCVTFDPNKALEFARSQAPNLIVTQVDSDRFKKAVKDSTLTGVPEDVCKWENQPKTKTLKSVLTKLAKEPSPSNPEPDDVAFGYEPE